MQQGMLFHSIYAPGSGVYVEQSVFTLTGDFDVAVFERAWQRVVDRHAILRTAFLWEDMERPLQAVQRQVDLPIVRRDWRDDAARDERLAQFLAEDRQTGFALSHAPLMRLALIRYADREYKCVDPASHGARPWSRSLVLNRRSKWRRRAYGRTPNRTSSDNKAPYTATADRTDPDNWQCRDPRQLP